MQTLYLDVCIIDANPTVSKIFYDPNKKYDPSGADNSAPICFSDNGVGPSMSANSPQASTCAVCPRAEWTKINNNGKNVPWCSQKQKIALHAIEELAEHFGRILRLRRRVARRRILGVCRNAHDHVAVGRVDPRAIAPGLLQADANFVFVRAERSKVDHAATP